jgi:hypothetical protein
MQLPAPNAATNVYFEYCEHLQGAAEAWLDAEVLTAAEQKAVQQVSELMKPPEQRLRAAQLAVEAGERAVSRARARFVVRDVILDLRVHAISNAILDGPAGRKREHPSYRDVFGDSTPSDITRTRVRQEPEVVSDLLHRFDGTTDFDGKAAVRERLAQALQKSEAALAALETAEQADRRAGDDELQARLGVRSALEQAYGTLRAAFPGRRDFVESFFVKRESTRTGRDNEAGGGETGGATP